MAMTAREAAWTALQRWRKNGAWSDAALNAVLPVSYTHLTLPTIA